VEAIRVWNQSGLPVGQAKEAKAWANLLSLAVTPWSTGRVRLGRAWAD
jgi:hypothetical protein